MLKTEHRHLLSWSWAAKRKAIAYRFRWLAAVAIIAHFGLGMPFGAVAQTFDERASATLQQICANETDTGNLVATCDAITTGAGTGTTSGFGAVSTIGLVFLEKRRREAAGEDDQTKIASAGDEIYVSSIGEGINVFVTAGAEAQSHRNNRFEDGYDSVVPSVVFGGDIQVTEWLIAGLAVNYAYEDGSYDDGGHFDNHSYGPIAFVSFLPFEGAFADIAVGYARKNYFNSRVARAFAPGAVVPAVKGSVSSDNNGDEYSGGINAGYDHALGRFTVGPRLGLNAVHWITPNHKEDGNTGLELRYSGLDRTSLQSRVGAFGAVAISTEFGTVQPQFTVAWVHEYLNDSRNIGARYIDDSSATKFTFKRESPARDWAAIDFGISALLPRRIQSFINFSTIQGNERLVTYGGSIGLRMEF